MDPNIIGAPLPIRWLIAKWIAWSRGGGEAAEAYAPLGGKSPLLDNTNAQAEAVKKQLKSMGYDVPVWVSMRYWHPLAKDVVARLKAEGFEKAVLVPLYPQFSTTTVFSSLQNFHAEAKKQDLKIKAPKTCCYPTLDGFITASVDNIQKQLKNAPAKTRILFSAHGLPESVIKGGDPYQFQCEKTAAAIVAKLGIEDLDWEVCYQSKVGPMKWIGPSTEDSLKKAAADGVGVVIYPHAFVSEHVETLVEIDEEYRHMAEGLGIPYFAKAETVGTHPAFIADLADISVQLMKDHPQPPTRICGQNWTRCGFNCDF